MSKFSKELIRLRKARGLSQSQLADALNVTRTSIGNYEQGIREPSFEILKNIADYFDVNIASFFDDTEPRDNLKNTKISISQRLRQIMSDRDLKQIDIIRMCEPYCKQFGIQITQPDLSQYINGKNEPGQKKLWVLASALNVSEGWLMGLDVPINPNIKYNESTTEKCNKNAIAVGKRIKTKRMLLGLTQQQLADRAGFESRTSINKIELGSRSLSASKIKVIADALHTTPEYIMGWNQADPFTVLAERYELSDNAISFIKSFVELPEDDRDIFLRFIKITKRLQK